MLLLAQGAPVDAKDDVQRTTPLHLASLHGARQMAALLLESGASSSARAEDGSTPLHLACLRGHGEVARLLPSRGADVGAAGAQGAPPLHYAAHNGHSAVAALLLDYGADGGVASLHGATALHMAAVYGHVETVSGYRARRCRPAREERGGVTRRRMRRRR